MRKAAVAVMAVLVLLPASFLALATPASGAASAENTWASKAPMHKARAGLGVAVVNGKIYAIGGTTAKGQSPPDMFSGGFVGTNEEYDPATDTWTSKARMPTSRDYFAIAAYGNKIYCIGGAVGSTAVERMPGFYSYVTSGANEVYDPTTDTWETKTPCPDEGMKMQAHVVSGKIYVADGSLVYTYDPENDSWAAKTRMPKPWPESDSSPVSAVVGNKIVVTFKFSTFNSSTFFTYYEQKVVIYDTETDSWSGGKPGTSVVIDGAAVATAGVNAPQNVYVLGLAIRQSFPPSTNQVYDPEADAWTPATAMPTRRLDFGVAVVDDVLYVIGGYYTSREEWLNGMVTPVAVNEQYTPFGYGTVPPVIDVVSPVSQTYNESDVSLVFTVNKAVDWTGYSLDGGATVAVGGNVTLEGLANGVHNVTVYARDAFGNVGASGTVSFTVDVPEPFPTALVVTTSGASVVVVGAVLAIYFKKRKRSGDKA
jgi:hypothetical protein